MVSHSASGIRVVVVLALSWISIGVDGTPYLSLVSKASSYCDAPILVAPEPCPTLQTGNLQPTLPG